MAGRDIPAELDTVTCLRLGQALYRFMARLNDESELDKFQIEDTGISIDSGFIEIDREALWTVLDLMDPGEES